ncbi:MAG: hypothetical protein ACP5NA_00550 [Candidatus Acidulodesulfobacterium sp.]
MLSDDNLDLIRYQIEMSYKATEEPVVKELRNFAKKIKDNIKILRPYTATAVSFVSADGGNNNIKFNPCVLELVRVVDSRGVQCAIDPIFGNSNATNLNERVERIKPLKRLCADLGLNRLSDISYLLAGIGQQDKTAAAVKVYRDIVEWAILYDFLYNDWGNNTIIIREGLLRTKSIKNTIFPKLDKKIKEKCEEHKQKRNINVNVVGVAKESAVISRLSLALAIENVFKLPYSCYVKVPDEIEQYCYNYDRTWFNTFDDVSTEEENQKYASMGKLFLVKFGDGAYDPVWPVDIAAWDIENAEMILGQLLHDARLGFPIPDFPLSIQNAHGHAKINGIEVELLEDMLIEGISKTLTESERESIYRMKYLHRNLTEARYKNA